MKDMNAAQAMIEKYMTIKFDFTDFFYAYCNAKGFDDPEDDPEMTEELYTQLEQECAEKIDCAMLSELNEAIIHKAHEMIFDAIRVAWYLRIIKK